MAAWDFSGQNLTNADMRLAILKDANFTDAICGRCTPLAQHIAQERDFAPEQLYATASYQNQQLQRIELIGNDMTGWDFTGQDLTAANFSAAVLYDTNFAGANVTGTNFEETTSRGFMQGQLYSTKSYQEQKLPGIVLAKNDLTGWNFRDQDLTGAALPYATLTNAHFSDAIIAGADLRNTVSRGFTREQLYSTQSYQARKLPGIVLAQNDLTGWNFSGQDLTGASLPYATLINADFSNAIVAGADLQSAVSHGFTREQLYSTQSYQARKLPGIVLAHNDLTAWDFSGQDLSNADLQEVVLRDANLTGADLTSGEP